MTTGSQEGRRAGAGAFVESRISRLQHAYLAGGSTARGQLAALRKAAAQSPGSVPEVWELTQPEVPTWAGDEPTPEEQAVHTAMTLYALHQQSGAQPVHVRGASLGQAAARLIGWGDSESPGARARFNALVTSTTLPELTRHLRTFVSLLRARGIGLDYARLADDLVLFQAPGGAVRLRRRWARDLYRRPASGADPTDTAGTAATDPTTSTTDQES